MLKVNKKLTPYNYNTMTGKKNEYIVIHYVGAVSTAKNNADYYASKKLNASAHYFVDETSIWQSVEDKNKAWHCGGGLQGINGHKYYEKCTNSNSIGVEMCVKKDVNGNWYFEEKTVQNTVDLVKHLMEIHNIDAENVIRHYDVTGKLCPMPYVDEADWNNFKERIESVKPEDITPADAIAILTESGIISEPDKWYFGTWNDDDFKWLLKKIAIFMKK